MFYSKMDVQRVKKVQYKTLQELHGNHMATYDELLALDDKTENSSKAFAVPSHWNVQI